MAMHPEIATKMRAEVLEHCGSHSIPTVDQIYQLKYSKFFVLRSQYESEHRPVRAVLDETLRLFPPVPLNVRESRSMPCLLPSSDPTYLHSDLQDQLNCRPLFLPKNTIVTFLPLLTQRNKALWGEDADEFRPERWLESETKVKCNANMGMFMPFSHGPRIVRSRQRSPDAN